MKISSAVAASAGVRSASSIAHHSEQQFPGDPGQWAGLQGRGEDLFAEHAEDVATGALADHTRGVQEDRLGGVVAAGVRQPANVLRVRRRLHPGQRAVLVASPRCRHDGRHGGGQLARLGGHHQGRRSVRGVGAERPATTGVGDPDPPVDPLATGDDLLDGAADQPMIGLGKSQRACRPAQPVEVTADRERPSGSDLQRLEGTVADHQTVVDHAHHGLRRVGDHDAVEPDPELSCDRPGSGFGAGKSAGRHRVSVRGATRRRCPSAELFWTPLPGSAMVTRRTGEPVSPERADVAQLVEHHLAKVRVAGSNPVVRSEWVSPSSLWRSKPSRWSGREARQRTANPCTRVQIPSPPRAIGAAVARFPDTEEVTGSIPVSPTSNSPGQRPFLASALGPSAPSNGPLP